MSDLLTRPRAEEIRAGAAFAPVSPVDVAVEGLAKRYGAAEPVFENVSFRLARGEAAALVGANGTGKSTLLRCLMGLVSPSGGRAEILGTDIAAARPAALRLLRAQIGLVSQKHNLVPRLSVLSNVIHGLMGSGSGPRYWTQALAPEPAREAATAALEKVGLADLARRRADRLSGGQSQRVAIARALVARPKFLIADEPCASLDPQAGEDVMALFFNLVREEGVTVLFTSHNIEHALQYGDRILGLAGGRLQLDATAASLDADTLRTLYA
ncbi:MAG: ATP-binding cassette domain-containing protein [Pseudomonadota bacterium]